MTSPEYHARGLSRSAVEAMAGALSAGLAGDSHDWSRRDHALWRLGCTAGLRQYELLRLQIRHVYADGAVLEALALPHRAKPRRTDVRMLPLEVRQALADWLAVIRRRYGRLDPDWWLFFSRKGQPDSGHHAPLGRSGLWDTLKDAATRAQLDPAPVSAKSMRASFLRRRRPEGNLFSLAEDLRVETLESVARFLPPGERAARRRPLNPHEN